jgi:2-polyprenyl-3-methyl-5-hydroxy-6-metoxy-1,4-benzoquinol methylase
MDNVLEHIKNPNNLLLECKRVIKPNGILLIGVPGEKGFNSEKDHKIHYNQKSLILKLKKFKFKHIKTFYRPFKFSLFNNYLRQYCMYSVFKLQD